MTQPSSSILRSGLRLFSLRLVLRQIGLGLLVFLLWVVWLRMPDASGLQVAGSAALALLLVAVAGVGEPALMLSLCGRARTYGRLLRGSLVLVVCVLLWLAWYALIERFHGKDYLYAGYLNSRFPHAMRYAFTFGRLMLWLSWLWTAVEWIGAGVLGLFVFCATASMRPLRCTLRALGSVTYWIVLLAGAALASVLTGLLLQWTPGQGLRIEMVSLILRLGASILVDASAACLLLAILAAVVQRSDALYSASAGTPDDSHPRTAETP